jgi:hypothetical protein
VVELIKHDALHLHVGGLILLGDELLVHDLESVDIAGVLLLGPYHLPFQRMQQNMDIPREPQFPRQHIRGMEVLEKLTTLE